MLDNAYGRCPLKKSRNPFTCGISGRTYTAVEMVDRVEHLSQALSKEFGWHPNKGTEWDKVIGIFALNTVCRFLLLGIRYGECMLISSGRFHDAGLCCPPTFWYCLSSKCCIFCFGA